MVDINTQITHPHKVRKREAENGARVQMGVATLSLLAVKIISEINSRIGIMAHSTEQ